MGDSEARQKYIHNFARTLFAQLHMSLDPFRYRTSPQAVATILCGSHHDFWNMIVASLNTQHDEVIGRLAMAGRAPNSNFAISPPVSMEEVFIGGSLLLKAENSNGENLVRKLAMAAVVAAMADNIWEEIQKARREAEEFIETQSAAYFESQGPGVRQVP